MGGGCGGLGIPKGFWDAKERKQKKNLSCEFLIEYVAAKQCVDS